MSSLPVIPTDLLESPSFQLERLRRRTRDEVEGALAAKKTSLREYWVLTCLVDGKATRQSHLCEQLAIDASDMVRLVDALEKRGWAKRTRDPKDRRRQLVAPSKKGRNVHEELHQLVTEAEDRALDESSPKQLKQLRKLARAIIEAETVADEH